MTNFANLPSSLRRAMARAELRRRGEPLPTPAKVDRFAGVSHDLAEAYDGCLADAGLFLGRRILTGTCTPEDDKLLRRVAEANSMAETSVRNYMEAMGNALEYKDW